MSRVIRPLLVQGNQKLSAGVFHFDLPAVATCPGRSRLICERRCYATKGRFVFPQIRDRLEWNYRQSLRRDFVDRMVNEIYRQGILLCRFHVSGDLYSAAYARKVLDIIGQSPHCTVWLYSRSWRIAPIFSVIRAISELPNAKIWLSADAETGYPPDVPEHCRVAWMQTTEDDGNEDADLVFLDRPLRKLSLPIANVCPTETAEGKDKGTTCATCTRCWK